MGVMQTQTELAVVRQQQHSVLIVLIGLCDLQKQLADSGTPAIKTLPQVNSHKSSVCMQTTQHFYGSIPTCSWHLLSNPKMHCNDMSSRLTRSWQATAQAAPWFHVRRPPTGLARASDADIFDDVQPDRFSCKRATVHGSSHVNGGSQVQDLDGRQHCNPATTHLPAQPSM
jgi:hypothetical protein